MSRCGRHVVLVAAVAAAASIALSFLARWAWLKAPRSAAAVRLGFISASIFGGVAVPPYSHCCTAGCSRCGLCPHASKSSRLRRNVLVALNRGISREGFQGEHNRLNAPRSWIETEEGDRNLFQSCRGQPERRDLARSSLGDNRQPGAMVEPAT